MQWAWGLDGNHDRGAAPPDQAMQQATVNLFADMGAQPARCNGADLVAAAERVDRRHSRPTSSITSPADGAHVPAAAIA